MYQAIITRDGVPVATLIAATALGAECQALDYIEDAEEAEDYLGEEYGYQVEPQPAEVEPVERQEQDALQHAWDELQGVPSLIEEEVHQIALQTEMEARDAVCSEAFSDFLNAELERELQAALTISSCWDIEDKATQERFLALNAIREQEDRETAEFYRIMAEAQ